MIHVKLMILFGAIIYYLGLYFVWFNYKNIIAHLNVGKLIIAFILPVLFINNTFEYFDSNIVELYALIFFIGGLFHLIGIILGGKSKRITLFSGNSDTFKIHIEDFLEKHSKLIFRLFLLAIVGIIIAFLGMGYVPIFTDDPLTAKFFRGPYKESYDKVKIIYRISYFIIITFIPFILALYVKSKKKLYLWISLIALILIFMTLTRAPLVSGLIAFIFLLYSKNNKKAIMLIIMYTFIIGFGSISYKYLFMILGLAPPAFYSGSFLENVVKGMPDLNDQLLFLTKFTEMGSPFTNGMTFIGALIPNNFPLNPSVWTLTIMNGGISDISNIASGGIRLPVYIWGYVSFGWIGVILVSLVSGFFLGNLFRFFKYSMINSKDIYYKTLIYIITSFIYIELANFYLFSMYDAAVIIILIMTLYATSIRIGKKRKIDER
ncbi:hypothetical protein BACSP_00836 [Bacillus sp. T2.9-1]|uniref:O-antigen polymerase n=1 Tax=Bacillus sp. T2.9-1 TaxID=3041163 RepID=UPI0024776A9C|nr:O-antigen polymerase [Bacillus sp. T2.9-1]CAI9395049.1 hypothetical protein BACSP_00836 [Bacillus sp. T2.9-1]